MPLRGWGGGRNDVLCIPYTKLLWDVWKKKSQRRQFFFTAKFWNASAAWRMAWPQRTTLQMPPPPQRDGLDVSLEHCVSPLSGWTRHKKRHGWTRLIKSMMGSAFWHATNIHLAFHPAFRSSLSIMAREHVNGETLDYREPPLNLVVKIRADSSSLNP